MRALICAAGTPPDSETFWSYARTASLVIAADGGLKWLRELGAEPDILVGDMDSLGETAARDFRETGKECVQVSSIKDDTDSELAAQVALEKGARELVFFGATGDRLDHVYSNLMLLRRLTQAGVDACMVDSVCSLRLVNKETEFSAENGRTFSLLPFMGPARATVEGEVRYPVSHLLLREEDPVGVSNVLLGEKARLLCEDGWIFFTQVRKKQPGEP